MGLFHSREWHRLAEFNTEWLPSLPRRTDTRGPPLVRNGVRTKDYFGYADGIDGDRYLGLVFGERARHLFGNTSALDIPHRLASDLAMGNWCCSDRDSHVDMEDVRTTRRLPYKN